MSKRILVPLVPGADAEAVVPIVGAVARETGATVRLLHVSPVPEPRLGPFGRVVATPEGQMERINEQVTDDLRSTVETALRDVAVETAVRFGDPLEEILVEADAFGADLIAVGGPRSGRLERLLKPSTAEQVFERSGVPVLMLGASRS